MSKFIMLIGAPCAGKSTWIKENISDDVVILSTDNLIEREAEKLGMTYSEAFDVIDFKSLEKEMYQTMYDAISDGKDILMDRTNMTEKSRSKILSKIPSDYEVIAIVFDTPLDVILERNKIRAEETGKHIPEFVIKNMYNGFVEPTTNEGFDHVFVLSE